MKYKYIVYMTINKINFKFYIGVHKIQNETWDFYLGNGAFVNKPSSYNKQKYPLHAAICKYGVNQFFRVTLYTFNSEEEALQQEALLVDSNFLKRKDVYNIALGGGNPPLHTKNVYQYDLEGNFIKEWATMTDITVTFKCWHGQIRSVIKDKRSYNDSYWSFEKFDKLNISEYKLTTYRTNVQVYSKDGELLNEFDSIISAAKFYEEDQNAISNAIYDRCSLHGRMYITNGTDLQLCLNNSNKVLTNTSPVFKYDVISGDFIEGYNSIKQAEKENSLRRDAVWDAVKRQTTITGWYWSYYKVNNILNTSISTKNPNIPKKIEQLSLDGMSIKIWEINECRKLYPNCIRVCRGARNKAYGFKWKYVFD